MSGHRKHSKISLAFWGKSNFYGRLLVHVIPWFFVRKTFRVSLWLFSVSMYEKGDKNLGEV